MAQEYQYFYEDEVYRFNKKGNLELGMVLENAEFVSSDEESDNDEEDKVTKGSIRVAWYPKGEEQVLPERKVGLADRSLMPGDVVRRLIRGKDTQRGYCRQVHVTSSVQVVGTNLVILNVDSNDLTPLEEFTTDIAVALDSWVGMVHMVKCRLVMQCSDGSRCIMSDGEALVLDDIKDTRDRDSEFRRYDFYPGQQLVGCSVAFEDVEWLHRTREMQATLAKPHKSIKVTVDQVQVVQLGVRWQCRAFSNDPCVDKEQPKYLVQGEDLKRVKMLNVFEPCTLQLGDRNYYSSHEGDVIMTREQWRRLVAAQLTSDYTNPCPLRPRPAKTKTKRKVRSVLAGTLEAAQEKSGDSPPQAGDSKDVEVSGEVGAVGGTPRTTPAPPPPPPPAAVSLVVESHAREDLHLGMDSDGYIDLDTDDCSDTASISSGASTGSLGRRNKKGPALMTKMMKKRKLKRAKRKPSSEATTIKAGDQLVVETLMTTSKADVVWQDGTLEQSILSTVLYPIHHLDDQEFFPGDFVVEQRESLDPHEYGVVQRVDHAGRTSIVKWFRTYTAGNDPRPQLVTQQEMSVYDLRDHPDFRYRPGSVVIRVANFEEQQKCFTGQVLDNFPSGEVSVWWVDGQKSVCYPQDLYKVGEYDSDDGELWDDTASDESWETESEHSVIAEESESESEGLLKTRLVANIEKARIAMSRLEEIFTQNPALQTTAVMKQLLDCYKECRSMDKLMGTSFFHESNFQGLIEKVRERGRASTTQRMTEQIHRLFSTTEAEALGSNAGEKNEEKDGENKESQGENNESTATQGEKNESTATQGDKPQLNKAGQESKTGFNGSQSKLNGDTSENVQLNRDREDKSEDQKSHRNNKDSSIKSGKESLSNLETDIITSKNAILSTSTTLSENLANLSISQCKASRSEKLVEGGGRGRGGELRHKRMSETDMTLHDKSHADSRLKDSKSCNDLKMTSDSGGVSEEIRTSHMCAQLCSLMKAQLLKTYEEVVFRFGGHFDMSLMQACQDVDGAQVENKDNGQSDNKENIPVFEDLMNENTAITAPIQDDQYLETESVGATSQSEVEERPNPAPPPPSSSPPPSPTVPPPMATPPPSLALLGGIPADNGNNCCLTDKNHSALCGEEEEEEEEEEVTDELLSDIIAGVMTVVNGDIIPAAAINPTSPDAVVSPIEGFLVLEAAPDSHKFKLTMFQPTDPPHFYRTVRKEMKLLKTSLPPGIWVRGYEDRMDLYSVMIRGPERTPYEDGLFFFDFQLSADYPRAPPLCHYVTYCSDKLNPNLYEDGKVCVSLLGTWSGKGTEVWTSQSNLLQVIISIQGLILVSEPYFNEAGYERQKGTQQGRENSRMYNEMVVLKLIQAMAKVIHAPPDIFKTEIIHHFLNKALRQVQRLECWLEISENYNVSHPLSPTTPTTFREIHNSDVKIELPEFPLIPASKGFCITLRKTLQQFKTILESIGVPMEAEPDGDKNKSQPDGDKNKSQPDGDKNKASSSGSQHNMETKPLPTVAAHVTESETVSGGNS